MRLYSRDEIERLRFIKRLVDEMGINLAGVQQLLEVAEAMRRIQRLIDEDQWARGDRRRRLLREIGKLNELLGI
jgi:MerR family transcriptional regulator/heat shock protein HspR